MNRKDWSHYYPSQGWEIIINYEIFQIFDEIFREMAMRLATSPHHTNPRSATLDFWRQTTSVEEYKKVQERRRLQTNRPTSSNEQKEEHLVIGEWINREKKSCIGCMKWHRCTLFRFYKNGQKLPKWPQMTFYPHHLNCQELLNQGLKRSISSISTRVITVFKNCPQGLPLKFQGASFGAIKFFWGKIFTGSLTGSGPEITVIIYSSYVFRPNVTCMACCWGSVVTEISVAWVMALKCQKKVRTSSRKKSAT